MEIAYVSEFTEGEQVIRAVGGDARSFGFGEGTSVPLEETYCRRMVEGAIPAVIPDARADERVRDLDATAEADIGSYIGVPLRLSDGRIYGTLCCASHDPQHALGERHARFMRLLARLIADRLEIEGRVDEPTPRREVEERPDAMEATARLTLWFAGAPNAAAAARHALGSLDEQIDESRRYDLRLLITELVTNSVRHAGIGPVNAVGLEVAIFGERVRVEVSDPGPGFEPEIPVPDLDRAGGWGLYLVDELTDRWGVARDGLTRVWFEMEGSAPARDVPEFAAA